MPERHVHPWNVTTAEARAIQLRLAGLVSAKNEVSRPRLLAGVDISAPRFQGRVRGTVVVLSYPELGVVEIGAVEQTVDFPYIPGLLSFREAPVCLAAVENLAKQPDVFIIDGQGIAHPRRLGLAAHLGLFFDKPTIGCAKSRLIGQFEEPPREKGRYNLLTDSPSTNRRVNCGRRAVNDEIIGAVLRTRANVKPVFVSVGHKCLLEDAIKITLACATRYRLPEPTRLAHQLVSRLKLKI